MRFSSICMGSIIYHCTQMVAKDGEECAFHFSSANISGAFLVCQAQSKTTRDVRMSDRSPWSLSTYRQSVETAPCLNLDTNLVLFLTFPVGVTLGKEPHLFLDKALPALLILLKHESLVPLIFFCCFHFLFINICSDLYYFLPSACFGIYFLLSFTPVP